MAEAGNYLLIIKRDGSVQIHHPKGIKPLNWQPKTNRLHAQVEDRYCVFTASRKSPDEAVRMVMLNVALAQALDIQEEQGFLLAGSEAQMQATLVRYPELIEPGLSILDRALFTGVGDIDLFARNVQGRLVVVELKRAKATHEALHQLCRYVDAVRSQVPPGVHVRGIVAAPSITRHADIDAGEALTGIQGAHRSPDRTGAGRTTATLLSHLGVSPPLLTDWVPPHHPV